MPHESILKAQLANAAKPVGRGYPVASSSSLQTRSAQEMLADLAKQEEDDDRRKKEREAQKAFWNQKAQQEEEDKKRAAAAAAAKKKKASKVSSSIIFRSLHNTQTAESR
jgi:cell shape-determining protein MreC